MPELPEVETIKNILNSIVKNQTINDIEVLRSSTIDGDVNSFISSLKGETFLDVSRIGKYLIFHLSNDKVIISHLRMEGKYFEYLENEHNSAYAKVIYHLSNNHKLIYDDSRCFGRLKLSNESTYLKEKEIIKLGPEPFIKDPYELYKETRKIKTKIKTALLDQTLMTGLGNIYVDETLFASNIHPHTPAYLISLEDCKNIITNASIILNKAIKAGGSTIKSYHPGKDLDGNFQTELLCYGKSGLTCPRCGHTFLFNKTNGRGTTYCLSCQHKLGNPLNVGLTGKIASGKSFALEFFKNNGCEVISSDQIVKELYQKDEVIHLINKAFSLYFKDEINHKILRDYLLIHPSDKKKLERLIHPLVKKEIINKMELSKKDIRIIEVPLLFKAHYEDIFDTLIVIDTNEESQDKRLIERVGNDYQLMKEINKDNMIKENKRKAEFIIDNSGSKEEYIENLNSILNKLKSRLS